MTPSRITVHHTASRGDITSDDLHRWHVRERKWTKIGYHYLLRDNGDTCHFGNDERYRSLTEQGAGVTGQNEGNIHIALAGSGKFTLPQVWGLYDTVETLVRNFRVCYKDVYTHNEFSDTECPGMRSANLVLFLYSGNLDFIRGYIK